MRNKKGFTLIELLAVIVILAVIALIATPIILGIIEDTKKSAFKDSAYGISQAAKNAFIEIMYAGGEPKNITYRYTNGVETSSPGGYVLNYEGQKPQNGQVLLNTEGKISLILHDGKYCVTKDFNEAEVTIEEKSLDDCMPKLVDESGANVPVLSQGMTAIMWDGTNWVPASDIDDPYRQNWYDYEEQKWANARTNDGSMWVWIPRYAYQITTGYHTSTAGTINVIFLNGTTDTPTNGEIITLGATPTYSGSVQTNYVKHPAFWWDSNNNVAQDNGEQLTGFWVAKFETSVSDQTNACYTSPSNANCDVSTLTPKIIPNAKSWRYINVLNAYTVSLGLQDKTSIYGWDPNAVDTHLIKNSEWGAVTYLSISKYGKQTEEVGTNAANDYTTGCAGDTITSGTTIGCIYAYNTDNGVKASTSRTIYGVYDMSGGAWERIMANYNNTAGSGGISSVASIPNKYIDRYTSSSYGISTFGHAMYETSSSSSGYTSWYGDGSYVLDSTYVWLLRGRVAGTQGGIYAYGGTGGQADSQFSFRPVVMVGLGL